MLKFVHSVMTGGKSALLIQVAHNAKARGFSVIISTYKGNTRDIEVESRLGIRETADLSFDEETNMYEELAELHRNRAGEKIVAVLIDEAQFLTGNQVEELLTFTKDHQLSVQCYGLKTDYKTHLFPGSKRLIELADEIEELNIVRCRCGNKATLNGLFSVGERILVQEGGVILIEGSVDSSYYDPICTGCYLTLRTKI